MAKEKMEKLQVSVAFDGDPELHEALLKYCREDGEYLPPQILRKALRKFLADLGLYEQKKPPSEPRMKRV